MTPSINQAVLTHVVQALKEGHIRYCESLGFSPQELCELTHLSADDILFLSNSPVQFMHLSVNHDMLSKMLARTEQERQFQQRLEEALTLGASIEFINHYFGLSTLEVCARRRLIGLFVRQGRNLAADEEGGFFLLCPYGDDVPGKSRNFIIRYNLSVADRTRTFQVCNGGVINGQIYNNTILLPPDSPARI